MTLTLSHPSRLIHLVFDLALSRGSARKSFDPQLIVIIDELLAGWSTAAQQMERFLTLDFLNRPPPETLGGVIKNEPFKRTTPARLMQTSPKRPRVLANSRQDYCSRPPQSCGRCTILGATIHRACRTPCSTTGGSCPPNYNSSDFEFCKTVASNAEKDD